MRIYCTVVTEFFKNLQTTMEKDEEDEEMGLLVAYLFSPVIIFVAILLVRTLPYIHQLIRISSIFHPFIHFSNGLYPLI